MTRPISLLVRTNLVLAVSAVGIAVTAIVALNAFVIEPIAERSADDEAALLVLSAQTWVELPPGARPYFELELAQNHDLIISSEVRSLPLADTGIGYLELLQSKLSERIGEAVALTEGDELIWANVPMGGHTMQIGFASDRRDIQPAYVGIIIVVMGAAIVFGTSLLIVQRIARPLVRIADLAETFRGGEGFTPLPERGPRELVTLANRFNTMAREIAALLSNRTTLLAGISHDLRTPMARMRLAVELLGDEVDPKLVARFEHNLEVMDELVGDALRFARGTGEPAQPLLLRGYLEDIVESIDESVQVQWHGDPELGFSAAPGALRRVLQNLVSNALQHGGDEVRVVAYVGESVEIHVVDGGPGIPEEYRDKVFQPFFRLDRSRSQATGGSGLGLAIVQQLCQAQGWKVEIRTAASGGADVVLNLGKV
ncbi:MAG: HAMP domain-containing protein [Gemmatimonadetes bacterium]|nr:MAG: HAMP domain-containing protein [Gemmatimonadota bacterium]